MKNILVTFITIALLFSCKKKEDLSQPTPEPAPTTIINYSDLNPDLSCYSIRGYGPPTILNECAYPLPEDSTASISLDIDQDNIFDYKVLASHKQGVGGCSKCGKTFHRSVNVIPLHPGAKTGGLGRLDEILLASGSWSQQETNIWTYDCSSRSSDPDRNYCGINLNGKIGWIHFLSSGKFVTYGFTITDFALNTGTSSSIKVGQKS